MKRMLLFLFAAITVFSSCDNIRGNGQIASEDRHVNRAQKIRIDGAFDVEITQGTTTSVKIEGDENLLQYILTDEDDGELHIHTKDHVGISTSNTIIVYITTPQIDEIDLSGSGKVIGKNKFTQGEKLSVSLSGSGDVILDLNRPSVDAGLSGSGNITLTGDTRELEVSIGGSGNYSGFDLKSEMAKISIAGSGNGRLFAGASLDVNIAGSGSVYYKGSPSISKNIVGSGDVKKENE